MPQTNLKIKTVKFKILNYYINLSARLLEKVKLGEDTSSLRQELYFVTLGGLTNKINTDELKVIFWENIYNAYLLIMLKEQIQPKANFLKIKRIKISRFVLSLNNVEYGILRKPKFKIDFHRLYSPFYPLYIKKLKVEKTNVSKDARLDKHILNQIIAS